MKNETNESPQRKKIRDATLIIDGGGSPEKIPVEVWEEEGAEVLTNSLFDLEIRMADQGVFCGGSTIRKNSDSEYEEL